MMDKQAIIQAEADYVLHTYNRPEIVFTHGEGMYLFDSDGNKYLDFTSGIAVTALGHSDPDWSAAVAQQATQLTHISNLFHSAPQVQLAQKLVQNSFADKVFFCNSGAEANEAALKFARKVGKTHHDSKTKIIAFTGGFHGRTMGSLSATYKAQYREPFAPLVPGFTFLPFNDLPAAQAAIDDDTCAVIVEPIQGEGGVNPATAEFLQGLRTACNAHHALLIFDEVQCGLGRTGTLWGHQQFGVMPDIMTLAKPLAGGLPIGATLVTQKVAEVIQPGDHGSTFAGGPLVCAAANVVFDKINQPDFLQTVQENGAYLKHRLQTLELEEIVAVRGQGLLVGVALNQPAAPIMAAARDQGVLILTAGDNVLRLAPALIVNKGEIDTAVSTIAACLEKKP
ncbi:MAG: acetylornithine transaminase [Ardenticatenaceae bacterium]|nr:acetylornithine transaminase [Anaerolineales bacterium]MCB8941399.1 acetylornithine transaminase [Ardenticatenaceae bacterium]MCB8972755.1 acetylornithine transaminase [Ardenticatenaceae bacterium]